MKLILRLLTIAALIILLISCDGSNNPTDPITPNVSQIRITNNTGVAITSVVARIPGTVAWQSIFGLGMENGNTQDIVLPEGMRGHEGVIVTIMGMQDVTVHDGMTIVFADDDRI